MLTQVAPHLSCSAAIASATHSMVLVNNIEARGDFPLCCVTRVKVCISFDHGIVTPDLSLLCCTNKFSRPFSSTLHDILTPSSPKPSEQGNPN